MAIIQGTMLYASELTWSGGGKVEGEYQPSGRPHLVLSWQRVDLSQPEPSWTTARPGSHRGFMPGP